MKIWVKILDCTVNITITNTIAKKVPHLVLQKKTVNI